MSEMRCKALRTRFPKSQKVILVIDWWLGPVCQEERECHTQTIDALEPEMGLSPSQTETAPPHHHDDNDCCGGCGAEDKKVQLSLGITIPHIPPT